MKLSATLLAALFALPGLAAQLEQAIEVPGVDSVVLACDNPGPNLLWQSTVAIKSDPVGSVVATIKTTSAKTKRAESTEKGKHL